MLSRESTVNCSSLTYWSCYVKAPNINVGRQVLFPIATSLYENPNQCALLFYLGTLHLAHNVRLNTDFLTPSTTLQLAGVLYKSNRCDSRCIQSHFDHLKRSFSHKYEGLCKCLSNRIKVFQYALQQFMSLPVIIYIHHLARILVNIEQTCMR